MPECQGESVCVLSTRARGVPVHGMPIRTQRTHGATRAHRTLEVRQPAQGAHHDVETQPQAVSNVCTALGLVMRFIAGGLHAPVHGRCIGPGLR